MKIVTQEELEAFNKVTLRGAIEGGVGGLAVGIPLVYLLHRAWPAYRALPISLKALGVVAIAAPACVIQAERAGIEFERAHWSGLGKEELDEVHRRERQRWDSLSTQAKVKDWAIRHRYGIVGISWATSMALAFGIIMRKPNMKFAEKLVQARMWAQGLTIGVLIATAGLAHGEYGKPRTTKDYADHSWRVMVEQELKDEKQRADAAANAASVSASE